MKRTTVPRSIGLSNSDVHTRETDPEKVNTLSLIYTEICNLK